MRFRIRACVAAIALVLATPMAALAAPPTDVLHNWYSLALELVRHTPTYTPPVASRTFAYLGVTAFEAVAAGSHTLKSLGGQLNGLTTGPQRDPTQTYDDGVILDAALNAAMHDYFSNTGPTGQEAIKAAGKQWRATAIAGIPDDVVARSEAFGSAVAAHIFDWSQNDGGAVIVNMGFPLTYDLPKGDDKWVPTSLIGQQQLPLLPDWGKNRTFAMPAGATCPIPPPIPYSVDPSSAFYTQAKEVYDTVKNSTPEQTAIARFWSDDAMLSTTPPGHWISITLEILDQKPSSIEDSVDILARVGIVSADAFIGCWHEKYVYDLVRPITYIKRLIDPKWEPILMTPAFPEYPSGHSTASAAAAAVLTAFFGENHAFEDLTGSRDGLKGRSFTSFNAAAMEAGMSRLYGGIHYRAAIERGLDQGRCIGAFTVALKTRS